MTPVIEVTAVTPGTPADGKLEVRDILLEVGGIPIKSAQDVAKAVSAAPEGQAASPFKVTRGGKDGKIVETEITPTTSTAPSASASGSASVRASRSSHGQHQRQHRRAQRRADVLARHLRHPHPRLAHRRPGVAGTGTIDATARSARSAASSRRSSAPARTARELFLVPPDNCDDALGARNGDMRLVKAVTMHAAVQAIEKWVKDPDAKLPTCAARPSGRPSA